MSKSEERRIGEMLDAIRSITETAEAMVSAMHLTAGQLQQQAEALRLQADDIAAHDRRMRVLGNELRASLAGGVKVVPE